MNIIVLTGSQSGMGLAMRQYLESQPDNQIIGVDLPGKGAEKVERSFQPQSLETALIKAREQAENMKTAPKCGGYDPIGMAEMQATQLFLDPMPAIEALDYGHDDLAKAIQDTVEATLKHK